MSALLGNDGRMISFETGGRRVRFPGPKCLRKFQAVKKWHAGYIEVSRFGRHGGLIFGIIC